MMNQTAIRKFSGAPGLTNLPADDQKILRHEYSLHLNLFRPEYDSRRNLSERNAQIFYKFERYISRLNS
ncbi:MAG: hypothetical protein L6Q59_06410 [Ignavibacteriaceae bacterium]|nr:hypothetical protein [Ignavibacteriaceae bacterium]